jgi:hypothetical protein
MLLRLLESRWTMRYPDNKKVSRLTLTVALTCYRKPKLFSIGIPVFANIEKQIVGLGISYPLSKLQNSFFLFTQKKLQDIL